jgi:hypothetical protein
MRLPLLLVTVVILSASAHCARAALKVTEADFQTYRQLAYADQLLEARTMFLRAKPAKIAAARAEHDKTWSASGWTRDRHAEVSDALNEVLSNLSSAKSGDMSADDLKVALAECDPTTVATVRAHYDELENTNDSTRAEKQVREEIELDRAGDVVSEAQLQGTWVFDLEATVELMGLSDLGKTELEKMKADIVARVGSPSYTFGPGNTMESRVKGADGQERTDKGVYRLDSRSIFFKAEGSKREYDLQIGLRDGRLRLGKGFGLSVFVRK